ncbi:MAG: IS1182 family transposase [Candidatus Omnitrophica bacterium]|nr:IS1182 family transposase [Candidatus Omnitrophota bacterium]
MKFRHYNQSQRKFILLNYREILGEDSVPAVLNDIIELLDIGKFEAIYVEVGNPAYHPKAMLKVLIYGYYKGYFGGRPLSSNFETDLGLRYLSNDDFPDFRTINLFRVKFREEIADIFSQVVMLCNELDLIGFENLSIDGQKIKANANVFQNKNLDGIRKEKQKIEKLLKKLLKKKIESYEDAEKIARKKRKFDRRKEKLIEAAEILKRAGGEDDKKKRYNLTDPESRVMTDKRGVKNPDYNTQNAVDDKCGVLTAVNVINESSDKDELIPMKEMSKKNTGQAHKNTLIDCGYSDKKKYEEIAADKDTEYYMPDRTMYSCKTNKYSKWNFAYDEERDVYFCPEGEELIFVRISRDRKNHQFRLYRKDGCENCKAREKCIKKTKKKGKPRKTYYRTISIYPEDRLIKEMRAKLDSKEGKKIYQRRMATVETVHGDMQKNRGFLQFYLRGLKKVNTEYNLLGIAHNIRKIILHGAVALKGIRKKAIYAL